MSLGRRRLAVIGGGNMGAALVGGLLKAKLLRPAAVTVAEPRAEIRRRLRNKFGVRVSASNEDAVAGRHIILLCVKPQQMPLALRQLAGRVGSQQLVLSIAAGVRLQTMERALKGRVPVIRVMPNTPALLRAGAVVYAPGRRAKRSHERTARAILAAAGQVWRARESLMDAVTALSGSGPADDFLRTELIAEAGRKLGLPLSLVHV